MKTYLFTWNPNLWKWDDLATTHPNEAATGKTIIERWSCGVSKRIENGSRAFLMRLGSQPKGVVGSGSVISDPFEAPHWDKRLAADGRKSIYVQCAWEHLLPEDFCLPLSSLKKLGAFNWTPQASGVRIQPDIAMRLENLWSNHVGTIYLQGFDANNELSLIEGEMRMSLIRHRAREQKLRDAKLKAALKTGKGHLKCEVPLCGFDFYEVYGEVGSEFAHVHHLKPLGERTSPSATRMSDLAIVCANCHAMIHRYGECRQLDGLITNK